MRIDRVEIDGFGKLNHVSLDFSAGFNLILGDNESGKSTLCEFLLAMFYELPNNKKTADEYENGRDRYRPWNGDAFGGKVYFTADDGTKYILEKTFGKTKNSDRAKLLFADTWEPAGDGENVGERFFGLGREGFIKTLYVKSLDANSRIGTTEILSRLSNMETGADEDVSYDKICAAMEKAHGQLVTKTGRGGKLPALYERKRELEAESMQLQHKKAQLSKTEQEAETLAKTEARLSARILDLEETFQIAKEHEAYETAKQAEHSRSVLAARYKAETQRLAEMRAAAEALANKAQATIPADALSRAKELEKQLIIAENKADEWKSRQAIRNADMEAQHTKRKKKRTILCGVILGITVLLSVVCFFAWKLLAAIILGAGVLAGVAAFVMLGKPKMPETEPTETEPPEQLVSQLQLELTALCKTYGADSMEALETLAREHTQAEENKKRLTESIRTLETETEAILKSIAQIRLPEEQAYSEKAISYSGATSDEIRADIQALSKEQERTKETLHALRIALAKEMAGGRSLPEVQTELLAVETETKELKKQDAAFRLAKSWLEKAHREIKENFAPRLNQKTAEIFSALTGEKYSEVRVGDNFTLHYKNETGDITEGQRLSSGTYDLLYISQRLGVLLTLFGETVPPMILDDAFVQMDDVRLQKAVSHLADAGAFGQTLAFTCHRESACLLKKENINFIDLNEEGVLEHGLQN